MTSEKENTRYARVQLLQQQIYTLMWMGMKQFVSHLQQYGLTQPQFVTLAALVHHSQPVTMQQLSKVTFQDAPTMTGIVNRLVKMGVVQRTRSEVDRRVVLVQATPAGANLIDKIDREMEDATPVSFYRLPDEDLDKLEEIIDGLLLILLKQHSPRQEISLAQAKQWLQTFAADPIQFVKNQEDSPSNNNLF